jgi:hypothetical protein
MKELEFKLIMTTFSHHFSVIEFWSQIVHKMTKIWPTPLGHAFKGLTKVWSHSLDKGDYLLGDQNLVTFLGQG